jgi:tetratricopeptide (TPR) repeat protein
LSTPKIISIPMERVFETRGILFHEIQAHSLALADLGRAVALDPERASNYFLRGDCHSKLGNYELALQDYLLAEEKGFEDLCSLMTARGMVFRLMGDAAKAQRDFESALLALPEAEEHRMARVRLLSLLALALIDQGRHAASHDLLQQCIQMVSIVEIRVEAVLSPLVPPPPQPISVFVENEAGEREEQQRWPDPPEEHPGPMDRPLLAGVRRLKWVLCYHSSLTQHMQRLYAPAHEALLTCVAPHMVLCAPDNYVLGAAYFFLAVQCCQLQRPVDAEEALEHALQSKWGQVDANQSVIIFAMGKLFQQQLRHALAVEFFTRSIALDASNAHAFFRRAWSFKVRAALCSLLSALCSLLSALCSLLSALPLPFSLALHSPTPLASFNNSPSETSTTRAATSRRRRSCVSTTQTSR